MQSCGLCTHTPGNMAIKLDQMHSHLKYSLLNLIQLIAYPIDRLSVMLERKLCHPLCSTNKQHSLYHNVLVYQRSHHRIQYSCTLGSAFDTSMYPGVQ